MLWSDVSQWGWTEIRRLRTTPCTTRHHKALPLPLPTRNAKGHCLPRTSQDNDGRADKTGLDLDAYECVGGAPPTEPGKVV